MRIAILSTPHNFHTQKWADTLCSANLQVSVFSFEQYVFANKEIENVCVKPTFTYQGRETYLSYLDGRNLQKKLKEHKIEVVFAINATPFGVWAAKANFHPCIVFAVGADILEYPPAKEISSLQIESGWDKTEFTKDSFSAKLKKRFTQHIFRYQVAQALTFADGIIADNQVLINAIHNWFNIPISKTRLIRGGVEPELFLPDEPILSELKTHFRIPPNATVIASPRGMKPIYQADIMIDAFEMLLQENLFPNIYFIALSAGYPIPPSLIQKTENMMQQYPNFFFEKKVLSRQKISQLWHLIDLFISAPIYDGYSASVAEGRFMGAIPVVNETEATKEILVHQETAWFVVPFTAHNLAKALKEIMLEKEAWKSKFAENNQQWIRQHSLMKQSVAIFIDFVNYICEKGSSTN